MKVQVYVHMSVYVYGAHFTTNIDVNIHPSLEFSRGMGYHAFLRMRPLDGIHHTTGRPLLAALSWWSTSAGEV